MGNDMTISIPLDDDGYMLLQCPQCGEYFKVNSTDYEAEDVEELWCPFCGLKNDSFLPDEVMKLIEAKALNRIMGDFEQMFSQIGKTTSRQSIIQLSVKTNFEKEREGLILPDVDAYEIVTCGFCGRSEKLKPLPKYVGGFCAFCGERL